MDNRPDIFDRSVLSNQIANLIFDILQGQGIEKSDIFKKLDFGDEKISDGEALLTFHEMFALIDVALRLSPIPWLGLKVGDAETVGTWGALGYAIMSSATEKEAAQIGPKYYQAAPSLMHSESRIEDGRQRIQMDPIYPADRLIPFCVEENIVGIWRVSSEYLAEPLRPLEIHLSYPKPVYARRYDEYFDCPVHYEQPGNILWTRAPTDQPLRTSDPASAKICLQLAEQMVKRYRGEDDFILTIRRELLRNPGEMPDMEEIASMLAMSSRTLRRKLDELDTSFRRVQDDVRKNLALDYLQNTGMNIDQIAVRLGYSETTNFRRAFKQWTGKAPSLFRV
ncbi:AraC family transcriptional regulator [Sphingorhabdus sp. EL138]|uniref:AraC family transcriptional regulator n=1 Tax=Sphingorhabdus sp. EL138 TaxID=2073156 RepID=UPI000D68994B|nr:AraC family transcriptional regulator [Sphingorhabdus sp. EL138]